MKINTVNTLNRPVREQREFVKLVDSGDYFKEMDYAIQNSPTATMAVLMFKKYCVLPNLKPEYTKLWAKIVDEKIKYGYFTLWVGFDADLKVSVAHFRQSKNYRAHNIDDVGNVAQYLNAITTKVFPAFNSDKDILKAQINKAGGFKKFSGQIYQYNTTSQPYEITPLFSVLNWMKAEEDTPLHIRSAADNALFGNNVFLMKKGAESSEDEDIEKTVSNTDAVIHALRSSKSVKNSGQNHVIEIECEDDYDLTKALVKTEISNDVDIDKFNAVDDKGAGKICTAAYCFPQILANPSEGLFGNSGDAYRTAIQFWKETCEFEAEKINAAFKDIGIELQQKIEAKEEEVKVDEKTVDAQAALKGSVGGVQALLNVQASYAAGTTSYESAIAILDLIFGFTREQAVRLLGDPQTPTQTPPTDGSNR